MVCAGSAIQVAEQQQQRLDLCLLPRLRPSRLLVVGCGPAAKRNYFPLLDRMAGTEFDKITALVELQSAREKVEAFTSAMKSPPQQTIWIPDSNRTAGELPASLRQGLDASVRAGEIDGVFILSEPKAHLPYLRWAIGHSLPVLLEKPLSAPPGACTSETGAQQIWDDYVEVKKLLSSHPEASVTLMAQRRVHPGFQFVMQYLRDFVRETEIPVTFVDVFKSDGQWTFPHEYGKENHPFKYGYGMLLHGGYHFIDVLAQAVEAGSVPSKMPEYFTTMASFCRPYDAMTQFSPADYARFFPGYDPEDVNKNNLGDLDTHAVFEFHRGASIVTHARISLMHNGFSRRAWPESKADTYKGNGRVRHERLHIVAGPLMSIMIHSYEAFEQDQPAGGDVPPDGEPGGHNHFDIEIFRNAGVIGGKPFELVRLEDIAGHSGESHVQDARVKIIRGFLRGERPVEWDRYELTFRLLSELARCAARHGKGEMGVSRSTL